jgi:hypothetical protein
MTKTDWIKKTNLIVIVIVLGLILFGYMFRYEFGLSKIIDSGSKIIWALIAGLVGVGMVLAPIFIWLGLVLGILFGGIYLILWSFKIFKPKTLTEEQMLKMETRHNKYGTLAKILGFFLVGCILYYLFVFPK